MTACADLYKKWKSEPNFCGLGKSEANIIDKYIEFVEEFSKEYDIPEDVVYRNAPRTAIKPILRFDKRSNIRSTATKAIAETLKGKHAITAKYVNTIIGIPIKLQSLQEPPKVIVAPISEPHREIINTNAIKDKIRLLTNALTTGQMQILSEVMNLNDLDNEYEAMSLIIKWAAERIEK